LLAHVYSTDTRVLIDYNESSGVAKHVRLLVKLKQKAPEMTCTGNASSLQEAASDADTNPSLPIGWFLTLKPNVCIPTGQN
jgi:hypothetical protein